jgi:nitrate reductase beta subunit
MESTTNINATIIPEKKKKKKKNLKLTAPETYAYLLIYLGNLCYMCINTNCLNRLPKSAIFAYILGNL